MFHKAVFLLGLALAAGLSLPAMAQAQPCQRAGRVKDIRAGAASAFPSSGNVAPVAVGGTLFFVADDGETGLELWKSDGTAASTVRVKDIAPGSGGSKPRSLTVVGNALYFIADDGSHGAELWRSDGTPAGTVLVQDTRPGPQGSEPAWLTPMAGKLFFVADDGVHGREIWVSDGTAAGTALLVDIDTGPPDPNRGVHSIATTGGLLLASVSHGELEEIWRSDGSAAGTRRVAAPYPADPYGSIFLGRLTPVGDTVFFTGELAPRDQVDLWKTDGTEAGTVLVRTVGFGVYGSKIFEMVPVGGLLYFTSDFPQELWRSDGTAAGTYSFGRELEGTRALTAVGGTLFFVAEDRANGVELYQSNGTTVRRVEDINPGQASSNPGALRAAGGRLLFIAADASGKRSIWTSDGTEAGTKPFVDIGAASPESSWLLPVGARIFFTATSPDSGTELWSINECASFTLQCPEPMIRDATSPSGATVTYPPATATGGGGSTPRVRYSAPSGSVFPLGTTVVTATAEDEDGNSASCTFTVTVLPPMVTPAPTPPEDTVPPEGCGGCSTASPGNIAWALLLLLGPALRRRGGRRSGADSTGSRAAARGS